MLVPPHLLSLFLAVAHCLSGANLIFPVSSLDPQVTKNRARVLELRRENASILETSAASAAAQGEATEIRRAGTDNAEEKEREKGTETGEHEILFLRKSNAELISQIETLRGSQESTTTGTTIKTAGLSVDDKEESATPATVLVSEVTEDAPKLSGEIEDALVTTGAASDVSENAVQLSDQSAFTMASTTVVVPGVTDNTSARSAGEKDQEAKLREEERALREAGVTRVMQGLRAENVRLRTRLLAAEAAAEAAETRLTGTSNLFSTPTPPHPIPLSTPKICLPRYPHWSIIPHASSPRPSPALLPPLPFLVSCFQQPQTLAPPR